MPAIIDYPDVLKRLTDDGFRCLYHNSGAFGFGEGATPHVVGWIGADDATIRPEALRDARRVPSPYERNLAEMFVKAWCDHLTAPAWVMPVSHWSYELEFGNFDWLPGQLRQIAIDPASLQNRNNGSAIEFARDENSYAGQFINALLDLLHGSDFTIAFPGQPIVCTLHHHKQLWWQTTDQAFSTTLRDLTI